MSERKTSADPETQPAEAARRAWISPELRTMRAGSAEGGPNPIAPEGAFAVGS